MPCRLECCDRVPWTCTPGKDIAVLVKWGVFSDHICRISFMRTTAGGQRSGKAGRAAEMDPEAVDAQQGGRAGPRGRFWDLKGCDSLLAGHQGVGAAGMRTVRGF